MPLPTSPATAAGAPTAKRSNPEHPIAELLGSRRPGCPWRRSRRSPANQAGSLLGLARDCLDRRSLFQRPTTGHSMPVPLPPSLRRFFPKPAALLAAGQHRAAEFTIPAPYSRALFLRSLPLVTYDTHASTA